VSARGLALIALGACVVPPSQSTVGTIATADGVGSRASIGAHASALDDRGADLLIDLEPPGRDRHAFDVTVKPECRRGIMVAHQAGHVRAESKEMLHEPRADDAGGAGDEHVRRVPARGRRWRGG